MNFFVSPLQKMQLRRVFSAFLVGLTIFVSAAFGQFGYAFSAQAATTVPETSAGSTQKTNTQPIENQAENSEGGLFDTIREKLNLDEPLPESTKLFFKQVQGEDVEVEEPRPSGKGNTPLQ